MAHLSDPALARQIRDVVECVQLFVFFHCPSVQTLRVGAIGGFDNGGLISAVADFCLAIRIPLCYT